jgi:hypothetical protein
MKIYQLATIGFFVMIAAEVWYRDKDIMDA